VSKVSGKLSVDIIEVLGICSIEKYYFQHIHFKTLFNISKVNVFLMFQVEHRVSKYLSL